MGLVGCQVTVYVTQIETVFKNDTRLHRIERAVFGIPGRPEGIPGNDDCGNQSSWYVFAALGFYPVNAATGVYVIGSPMVDRAVIRNPLSKTEFSITAHNNKPENCYIEAVSLNGKDLERSWITHSEIVKGGELVFHMSPKPNKKWGSAPKDRPPSGLVS